MSQKNEMGNEMSDETTLLDLESFTDIDSILGHLDSLMDPLIHYLDDESSCEETLDNRVTPTKFFRSDTPYTPQTPYTSETPFSPQTPFTPDTPFRPQTPYTSETPCTPQTPLSPTTPFRPQTPVSPFRPIELPRRNLNSQVPFWSVDFDTSPFTRQKTVGENVGLETIHLKRRDDDKDANYIMNQLSYLNEIRDCRDRRENFTNQMSVDHEDGCTHGDAKDTHGLIDRKRRAPGNECDTPFKKLKSITDSRIQTIVQNNFSDPAPNYTNLDINGNLFNDSDHTSAHETPSTVNFNVQKPADCWTPYDVLGVSSNDSKKNSFPSRFHYPPVQSLSTQLTSTSWLRPGDNLSLSPLSQVNIFHHQCLTDNHKNGDPSADHLETAEPFVANNSLVSCSRLPTSGEDSSQDIPGTSGTPFVEAENAADVKTKLKKFISSKRKLKGQADIKIDLSPKPKPVMTDEEVKRVERRMKLNKESAARYRKKKDERQKNHEEEEVTLVHKNMALKNEVNQLLQEIRDMKFLLRQRGYTDDDINAARAKAPS